MSTNIAADNETTQSSDKVESKPKRTRSSDYSQQFGERIRQLRTATGESLRGFAARAKIDPSYLSKIERAEFAPPGDEKIIQIAEALGECPEILLAAAGRLAPDVPQIIFTSPREFSELLRLAKNFTPEELERIRLFCVQIHQEHVQKFSSGICDKSQSDNDGNFPLPF